MTAEDHQEQPGSTDHGGGDLPGNAAGEQQIDAAGNQGQGGGADDAAGRAGEDGHQVHGLSRGQLSQRGSGRDTVHRVDSHQAAEGDQQEAPSGKSRVHDVVAQAAEEALDHQNGKHGTKDRDINRHLGRQGQGQQQARHQGRAIPNGGLPLGDLIEEVFRQHRRAHRQGDDQEGGEAMDPHADDGGRQQGHQHIGHDAPGGQRTAHMRCRRDIKQFIHFLRLLLIVSLRP